MAKKITLEQLARVVQGGFKEVDTKVDRVDAKVEDIKKDVKVLKTDVKVLKTDVRVLKDDVKDLKLTTQRIETRQEAEAMRHDRHSVLIVDHEKRIKVLEKV